MSKVSIIIPAFGLMPLQIADIVERLPGDLEPPLVIVNDQDETLFECVKAMESENRISALHMPCQVGKTEVVRRGIEALLQRESPDIIVQLDGNLKQPPEVTQELIDVVLGSEYSMVIGNRYALQDMETQPHRLAVTNIFLAILGHLTRYSLQDAFCGLRAYTKSLAEHFLSARSFGYGLEIEEILIAHLKGAHIQNYPVKSNVQAGATNAEKIEDNLHAIISYAQDMGMSHKLRDLLCFTLAQVKRRISFSLDLAALDMKGFARFNYIPGGMVVAAYSSGTDIDGYQITLMQHQHKEGRP